MKDKDVHLKYESESSTGNALLGLGQAQSEALLKETLLQRAQLSLTSSMKGGCPANTSAAMLLTATSAAASNNSTILMPVASYHQQHALAPALAHLQQQDRNTCILQSLGLLGGGGGGVGGGQQLGLANAGLAQKEKASPFRGITRRKRRWEAHVWRHGKQAYLGGYKEEEAAARAYDMAVIKIRGAEAETNFPSSEYTETLKLMKADELTVEEFIMEMREEAKKRSKQLREEEEDKRIEMLKQINEQSTTLGSFLEAERASQQQSVVVGAKRAGGQGGEEDHMRLLRKLNTEATLDRYLEQARTGKRQKVEVMGEDKKLLQGIVPSSAMLLPAAANLTSLISSAAGVKVDPAKNPLHSTGHQLLGNIMCNASCQTPCRDAMHQNVALALQAQQQQQQQQPSMAILQALQGQHAGSPLVQSTIQLSPKDLLGNQDLLNQVLGRNISNNSCETPESARTTI